MATHRAQPRDAAALVLGVGAVARVEQLAHAQSHLEPVLRVVALHLRVDDPPVLALPVDVVRLRQDVLVRQRGVQHLVQVQLGGNRQKGGEDKSDKPELPNPESKNRPDFFSGNLARQ